jgi:type I restriction enzyme R subunit
MNLIRSIDINDINKRRGQIKFIREQLDRSNNPELYKKIDLIRAFLDLLENGLVPESIDQAYEDFEAQERQKDIDAFLEENKEVDREQLTDYISEYEFSYIIDEGAIRDNIKTPMGLIKKRGLVRKVVTFIKSFAEKYQ